MNQEFKIGKFTIGESHPPFIIAEMSGNHNQSLDRALEIVEAAAKCGVQAMKLQTYTADTITMKSEKKDFMIEDKNSLWTGNSLHALYQKAHTPWDWHKPIFDRCRELGMLCFSTPFDETAVDFLEKLDVPCYKIASFENIHLPLIKKVAQTGKPVIISTGMANLAELEDMVKTMRENGNNQLVLLKCTSTYPASPIDCNINTIPHMNKLFDVSVGRSDHTMGVGVSIASIALGARVIEKHFCLSRQEGGVDSAFSMEPHEMKLLVEESFKAWQALGKISYGPTEKEKKSMEHRRSIYAVENIKKGETFTAKNVRVIRPGHGMAPKHYEGLLGQRSPRSIEAGTPIKFELFLEVKTDE